MHVTASDVSADGSRPALTSRAVVVVFITDVNDNRPEFPECADYRPEVPLESAPRNGSTAARRWVAETQVGLWFRNAPL